MNNQYDVYPSLKDLFNGVWGFILQFYWLGPVDTSDEIKSLFNPDRSGHTFPSRPFPDTSDTPDPEDPVRSPKGSQGELESNRKSQKWDFSVDNVWKGEFSDIRSCYSKRKYIRSSKPYLSIVPSLLSCHTLTRDRNSG